MDAIISDRFWRRVEQRVTFALDYSSVKQFTHFNSSFNCSGATPKRYRVSSMALRSQRKLMVMLTLAIRRARYAHSTDTLFLRIHFTNRRFTRYRTLSRAGVGLLTAISQSNSPTKQPMVHMSSTAKTVAQTGYSLQLFCSIMGRHSLLVQNAQ